MVYLDCNATTPLDERVLEAMLPFLRGSFGNPSAVYRLGREARAAVDRAREQIAQLVNAHPSQVVFTSGGTEANNFAIKGAMEGHRIDVVAVSSVEHASVIDLAASRARFGATLIKIPVDSHGVVHLDAFENVIREHAPGLVSVMWANNETGAVMPVAKLAQMAREHGIVFHSDAVQAAGKIPVDFTASGVGMLSLSAHKMYGPKGIGALVLDKSLDLLPLLEGGGQEKGRRSGTENVAAIVGFGMAAELALSEQQQRAERQLDLRRALEDALDEMPQVVRFSTAQNRLPNTVFFAVEGIEGEALLMNLDRADIAVASGSACASKKGKPSHVLLAMGVENQLAGGAIRVSVGRETTKEDISRFLQVLQEQMQIINRMSSVVSPF